MLAPLRQAEGEFDFARTWTNLGDAHHPAGGLRAAFETWQKAQRTLDEVDHHDPVRVRNRLGG